MRLWFSEHVYWTEDTLFQVLFDKTYRPQIYRLKSRSDLNHDKANELAGRYKELTRQLPLVSSLSKNETIENYNHGKGPQNQMMLKMY